jgi:hypothetical protein
MLSSLLSLLCGRRLTRFVRPHFVHAARKQSLFFCLRRRRMVHRVASSSCSLLLVAALFVHLFAAALGPNAAVDAVLLNFEGNQQVGSFYGGQAGGIGPDYGIFFGTTAKGAIDTDVTGGTYTIANVPSPSTALYMLGPASQAFVTVSGGFTALSFQYASAEDADVTVTVHAGPNLTGAVLATSILPGVGLCRVSLPPCGGPFDYFGVWNNTFPPVHGRN